MEFLQIERLRQQAATAQRRFLFPIPTPYKKFSYGEDKAQEWPLRWLKRNSEVFAKALSINGLEASAKEGRKLEAKHLRSVSVWSETFPVLAPAPHNGDLRRAASKDAMSG